MEFQNPYKEIDREALFLKYPQLDFEIPDGVVYYSREEADLAGAEFYFDKDEASDAVLFFSNELCHLEGELQGELFTLEVWQQFIIEEMYGWKRTATGMRRYREVFLFIPRKNGKSFFGAGIGNYGLYADGEKGAKVVSAAADTEQAALIFETAKYMVQENPNFFMDSIVLKRTISVPSTASSYQVISADAHTKHGKNLSTVIFDELHTQPNRDLVDVLFTSVGTRRQPLKCMFTTAGHDKNTICYDYYTYAKKVLNGEVKDTSFLPIIFEAEDGDDWKDEATWFKANPNLGVSITLEYFREEFQKAVTRPSYENTFKRLHLNIWTSQETKWLPVEIWDKCKREIKLEDFFGREIYVGVDLSSKQDLSSVVVIIPDKERVRLIPAFFMPAENIGVRCKRDRVKYDAYVRDGHMKATEGSAVDYNSIEEYISFLNDNFKIIRVYFDPWNAQMLQNNLTAKKIPCVNISQTTTSVSPATKELEALLVSEKLEHDGNEVMRWNFDNIVIEEDASGNIKASKKKSRERIDGVTAAVLGLYGVVNSDKVKKSIYEQEGARVKTT